MLYRENVSVSQDELEDVLEDLYGAGTFDSSGSFSVRADKAREKLANFRLQNPYSYIVHLYSFGYMSGAQEFSYSLGVRSSWMKFRGASFDPGMWDDIFSYLLFAPQDSREWAAHELALGLHSGTAAGGKRARIVGEDEGWLEIDGKHPINPSGGLIGAGHPVGATGVRQFLDSYLQVTGQAGDFQVEGAKNFQTLNIGGSGTTSCSFIVGV